MSFGRTAKIVAISLSGLVVILIAVAQGFALHIKGRFEAELSERLPDLTQKLGITLEYDKVAFNFFTGPTLQDVSIRTSSPDNDGPTLFLKSIGLLYSLHRKPEFHVRVDGMKWQQGELKATGITMSELSGTATYNRQSKHILFETNARVTLDYWRIANQAIHDIELSLSGDLEFDAISKSVRFDPLNIDINGFVLAAAGHTEFADDFKLDILIESERVPIQEALDAIPAGFAPTLEGAKVDGTIKIGMDFAIDMANLKDLKFEPAIEINDFKLLKPSKYVDIEKLKKPFMHKAKKKGEVLKEFMVGPPNYKFVPYQRLGKHTKKGVLTCEDGSFFRHNGFRVDHFRESLIQDIREKRFARGASTITMQTAKNLFLTGDKNLSRKFQEILIAYAMEQMLTKERILEIYMNIIEWGPKIYGIGAASKHYFSKWPKDLDPLEAAFLGSIIPTPVRSHHMYSRGSVPDQWATYLALIISKMGISGTEYEDLEPFQPEFDWVKKKRLAEEKKQVVEEKKKPKKRHWRQRFRRRR